MFFPSLFGAQAAPGKVTSLYIIQDFSKMYTPFPAKKQKIFAEGVLKALLMQTM